MLKKILRQVDKILCSYLGLDKEEICPTSVKISANKLLFTSVSSFKRYAIHESWQSFENSSLLQTTTASCEKLGLATGKAIAKNLVISFEKTAINQNHHE